MVSSIARCTCFRYLDFAVKESGKLKNKGPLIWTFTVISSLWNLNENKSLLFVLVTCPEPPDVPHGFVSEGSRKAEYQHGDIARFTCETGYTSGLPIKYECMRGEWRAINTGHCYCEYIHFFLGLIVFSRWKIALKLTAVLLVAFCLCFLKVKPCPLPEDTPNGYYEITSGEDLVFGTTIKYFCNEGCVELHWFSKHVFSLPIKQQLEQN